MLYSMHNSATDRRCAMSHSNSDTPPVNKLAPRTTQSSSFRCVFAAEHHTTEQHSKTGRMKLLKYLPRSNLSWKTCQDFLKVPSLLELLWKESEDAFKGSTLLEESELREDWACNYGCNSGSPLRVTLGSKKELVHLGTVYYPNQDNPVPDFANSYTSLYARSQAYNKPVL